MIGLLKRIFVKERHICAYCGSSVVPYGPVCTCVVTGEPAGESVPEYANTCNTCGSPFSGYMYPESGACPSCREKKTGNFWLRCVENGILIVPFMAYSEYLDGNEHESKKIGIRFVALDYVDLSAVVKEGDFYLDIEDRANNPALIGETPEEALALMLKDKGK